MTIRKTLYYAFLIMWFLSSGYLFYKYSLHAGYWLNPLLLSLFCYIALIIINKGFNKLLIIMGSVYIVFALWFTWDFITDFLYFLENH